MKNTFKDQIDIQNIHLTMFLEFW